MKLFHLQVVISDLGLWFHRSNRFDLISDARNIPKFVSLGLWMHYYGQEECMKKRNMVTERGEEEFLDEVEKPKGL